VTSPQGGAPIEISIADGEAVQLGVPEEDEPPLNAVRPEPVEGREPATPSGDDDEEALLGWGALPDLVIVDGGKGQLSAALDVMRNLGLAHVPLAGLAKQNEELFVQDLAEPIVLPRTSQALYLVQRIRDEAHRFAITYHRQVRTGRTLRSQLDDIPGIGPKRKKALIRRFGSLRAIAAATVDDLTQVEGISREIAERVKEHIGVGVGASDG
jgi:excinuclease ABC subunit C